MKGLFIGVFVWVLASTFVWGAQDSYLSWAMSYWGAANVGSTMLKSSQWGENADPDGDGIVNLIEYATKTDPTRYNPVSDAWQFSVPPSGAAEYRFPQITAWIRTDDPDLRVIAQTSQNLAYWTPSSTVDFSLPQPANPAVWEQEISVNAQGLRHVRYLDKQSMAGRERAFMRLTVVRRSSVATTPGIDPFFFTSQSSVLAGSVVRSNAIVLGGFAGSLTVTIPSGVTLYVNGVEQTGPTVEVQAGDTLWMQATAPQVAGVPRNHQLVIGGTSASWSYTTAALATVPDHPGEDSGYTPVETGVSETGAAQISIPIVVAPGTGGMQPKLSVNYSSQGGNGPLGVGFSLGGLSTISRVGRTVAQDGVKGGVNFDANDRFALDGQRLIAINGADGADGTEYRLEFDPTSRIRSYGAIGSGPHHWIVETKAGLKIELGNASSSRIFAEGCSSSLVWAVSRITDTAGNSIAFLYDDSARRYGEMLLLDIAYTSNSSASLVANQNVILQYESRPDVITSYVAGFAVKSLKRLSSIESKVMDEESLKRVRRYDFGYQQSIPSRRSQLISVTESMAGVGSFSPTYFTWHSNDQADTLLDASIGIGVTPPFDANPPAGVLSGDFDADGIADMLKMNDYFGTRQSGDHWLATGNFLSGNLSYSTPIVGLTGRQLSSADDGSRLRSCDLNGDGRTDLFHLHYGATSNFAAISDGDGSFTLKTGSALGAMQNQGFSRGSSSEFLMLDINGDGRSDVVYLKQGAHFVALGKGDGSFSAVAAGGGLGNINVGSSLVGGSWVLPGDFNGDGLADILHLYYSGGVYNWLALSNGDGTFSVRDKDAISGLPPDSFYNLTNQFSTGDFNGDGVTDVICIRRVQDGANWLAFGKGDGSFRRVNSIPGLESVPTTNLDRSKLIVGDWNADGLTDLFHADQYDVGNAWMAYSKGDGSFELVAGSALGVLTGKTYSAGISTKLFSGDFDGDGTDDILHLQYNGSNWLARSAGYNRQFVVKVQNGHGGHTEFDYKPLTDSSGYTKGTGSSYPCVDIQPSLYVVSSMTARNGIDGDAFTGAGAGTYGENIVSYRYEGAWSCLDGRGFMGFKAVETTDVTSGIVTRTSYEDKPLYAGRVKYSEQKLVTPPPGGSAWISTSANTWSLSETTYPTGYKTYFVREAFTTSRHYEVNRPAETALVKSILVCGTQWPGNIPGPSPIPLPAPLYPGGPYHVWPVTYDAHGNLISSVTTTTDGSEVFTEAVTNTYGDSISPTKWHLGRLATSSVTKTAPNPSGAGTVSQTRSSSFAYDATSGLLIQEVIEPSEITLRQQKDYTHDAFGNILTSTFTVSGEMPRKTATTYTPDGRFVASTTNALGHVETKTYDPLLGNVLTQTGPNGLTTSWEYDAIGRPVRETRPDGTVTRSFYRRVTGGTTGAPPRAVHYVRVQSSGGAPKTVWYDLLDREIRVDSVSFDGRTVSAHKVFNNRGEVTHASQPYFAGEAPLYSTMDYDAVGRETRQVDPGNRITTTTHNGLTTSVTNPKNQTVSTRVNGMGWTVQTTDSAGKSIHRSYDAYGNLRFVTDPAGNATELRYDLRGNKVWMSEPNSGISTFTYNGFRELKTQTNAAAQTVTLAYDQLGRMLTRTEPEGTTTFTFDTAAKGIGQLAREVGQGFERSYFYDGLTRPVATVESHGLSRFATSRSYDFNGRPDSLTYPSGFATRQVYNLQGHLTEVQNGANPATLYWRALQVNARGQVTQEALGNGIVTERAFEAETGLIQSVTSTLDTRGDVQNLGFSFDSIGNLTKRQDLRFATAFIETFGYDTLNRLESVNTTGTTTVTCAYNDLGNLTHRSDVGTLNYAHSGAGPHALTSVTNSSGGTLNKTCGYDVKGNRTSDGGTVLDYSSFNKPTRIRKGGDTLSFDYGPDRALYRQTIYQTHAGGAISQTVRDYIGGLYEREMTSEGVARHIHHIAGGNGVVAIHTDERSASNAAQRTRFIHKDHLGSVDVITDSSGIVVERQSFDAWGRRRTVTHQAGSWTVAYPTAPGSAETHRGFTGHEMLDLVGLVHMGGRIYDPITARFLSPDPFVQSPDNLQNLNRYSYVLNNPLSYTDPSGFFFKKLGKLFKTVVKMVVQHVVGNVFGSIGFVIAGPAGFAAGYGFGSAFSGTLLAGGSVGDALRAGLIGGASARLTFGIGTAFESKALSPYSALKPIVHGAAQGGIRVAQGGKFTHGFMSGALASQFAGVADMAESSVGSVWAGRAVAAVVGGTAEVIGGGKFGNGAMTGTFGRMFNDEAHGSLQPVKSLGLMDDIVSMMPDSWVEGIAENGQQYVDAAQGAMEGWDPTVIGIKSIFNEAGLAGNRSSDAYFNGDVVGTAFGAGKIIKGAESAYKLSRLSVGKNGLYYGMKRGAWSNSSVGRMWKDVREGLQDGLKEMVVERYGLDK